MNAMDGAAAAMRGDWLFPTEVRFGIGRLEELGEVCRRLGMTRPMIVTDRGLARLPLAGRVANAAAALGAAPLLFAEVQENPTGGNVEAGCAAFAAAGADGVIALGGGSALDCGKCIALLAGRGGSLWRFAWPEHASAGEERGAAPIVAIPTTAGTGAEVEASAIVTDETLPAKRAVIHPEMMPRVVIADPTLTVTMPGWLTAATGMDALSHNLEALCAPGYHPMADAVALRGVALAGTWLPRAVAEPEDLQARGWMMAAAIMGATAFAKGLGAMHALSHAIGALEGRHHGLTNAVLMPFVLAHNRPSIEAPMAELAHALRLPGGDFAAACDWILQLRRAVGIPPTLGALGVAPERFAAIARLAARDICAGTNPRPVDEAALGAILQAAA